MLWFETRTVYGLVGNLLTLSKINEQDWKAKMFVAIGVITMPVNFMSVCLINDTQRRLRGFGGNGEKFISNWSCIKLLINMYFCKICFVRNCQQCIEIPLYTSI